MNAGDQRILAEAKLTKRLEERETQIKAKIETITYRLSIPVHGVENLEMREVKILTDDLVELYADYQKTRKQLAELS